MIVQAAPWLHFGWLITRAGNSATTDFKAIEAVGDDGRIHGMVGYDNWTENSVIMSIALENVACFRSLLRPMFEYAFLQAGKGVAFATVRATNSRSVRLTERAGFREAYRLKDAIAVGEDMIIFEMRRENCRWIPEQHRKAA